jgi:hypothetical protein
MRAQLEKPVLDCPHPRELARFYAELLGMQVLEDSAEWVVIGRQPGMRELAFQLADPWVPPRWPDPNHPLVHLDIRVDDVDAAEQAVLATGATRAPGTPETGTESSGTRWGTRSALPTVRHASKTPGWTSAPPDDGTPQPARTGRG